MQSKSAFQLQFPLSSRKIIKKMVPRIIFNVLPASMLGAFATMAVLGLTSVDRDQLVWTAVGSFLIFAIVAYLLMTVGYYLYERAYINRYYYNADEHFLTIKKGVFAPAEIHVQYQKMQDVYVDQDLFDRLLGLYDVHIASATVTSGIEAHIDGVDEKTAEGLKNWLLGHVSGMHTSVAAPMTSAPTPAFAATTHVPNNVSHLTYSIQNGWYVQVVFQALVLSSLLGFWLAAQLFEREASNAVIVLGIVPIVLLFVSQVVMAVLWKHMFAWSLTPEFILTKEGVISRKETHVPYRTIQDVMLSQSIFERLLGLCTVKVENATAVSSGRSGRATNRGPRFPGQSLAKGRELVEILKNIRSSGSQQTGV